MSTSVKILALAGSLRAESFNKKLVRIAVKGAEKAGAAVTLVDLRDLPLPIYDGDLEAASGIPENGKKLKRLFIDHAGLMIASPEYNSSVTALLKNTIDWVSRPEPNEAPLAAFTGKVAAIMSASPGALGGLRGLVHLRAILGNIGTLVLPRQLAISRANDAFAADGTLKDPQQQAGIDMLAAELARVVGKLHG